jgi:hypothetical protein
MQYSITLPEVTLAALKQREAKFLRIRITYDGDDLILTSDTPPSCDASGDYQKWNNISFKNYGSYSEGLFGDCPAYIDFSHDGSQWIQIFGGYVSTDGMSRSKGYITDDYVSMELVDRTKTKGMKRKPPKAVLTGFKVCDPGNPSSSLVHYLGSLMGVDTFDTSSILDEKDVVVIGEDTAWRELQSLRDAFAADMYFDHLRRLRFRSPHDFSWTEPASEWTFIAHPDTAETANSSRIIGKIRTVRREVLCNKAESEIEVYEHRTLREVYRNTENWNADAEECYILVKEGESWPKDGVASLKYQDPDTNDEYPYAVNVQFPSIGRHRGNDIYYTGGQLSIISFNGSTDETEQEPGASQIILRNTGPTDVIIRKLVIKGEPFYHSKTQKVIERDGSVTDDVDLVDKTIDGKYATSAVQIAKTLKRVVDEGKVRPRRFSFSTIFLPQIQRGMGCTVITDDGESIACRLMTYNHKATGSTLATMRTDVIVDEVAEYVPEYSPKVIESPTAPSVPVVGPPGVPGTVTVVQYSLGGPEGPTDQSYEIGEDDYSIGEDDWILGEDGWTNSVPTPGLGQYVYMRVGSYAPPNESWPTIWRVTRLTGEPARGIRLEASSYTIEFSGRGVLRSGNITLRAQLQNLPSTGITWTSLNATLLDVDAVTKTLDVTSITAESFTVSVSMEYLGETYSSTITIAVVYDGEPKAAYFSYHYSQTLPTTTPTGEPLIVGDLLLYVPKDESEEWIDTDPLFGHVLRWDGDSWESTTDSASLGTTSKDAYQMARESGIFIYAAAVIADIVMARNLQAGQGTGLAGSGFRFRAQDDDYSQQGSPKVPVFDVYKDDKLLFAVEISTGRIFFGPHFWYDPSTGQISSENGKAIIHADGTLESTDGIYRGTVRAGENTADTARMAFRDESGVGEVSFFGTGHDDLLIVDDDYVKGMFEVEITSKKTVSYSLGDTGPGGGIIFSKVVGDDGDIYKEFLPVRDFYQDTYSEQSLYVVLTNLAGGWGGYTNWTIPTRDDFSAIHPAVKNLRDYQIPGGTEQDYWTRDNSPSGKYNAYPVSSSSIYFEDAGSTIEACLIVAREFTIYHDGWKWRSKMDELSTWSAWSIEYSVKQVELTGYGIIIDFTNNSGHEVGDKWTFDQGEMYGVSGLDRWGNEYFRAENGLITINNLGKYSLVLKNLPTESDGLPAGALWRDGATIKIV